VWIRIASMSLPLTFNKFDWQDVFQGAMFGAAAIAVAMIALALFAAVTRKRPSGPGAAPGDAGGNSEGSSADDK
jgi:hypothetical protein